MLRSMRARVVAAVGVVGVVVVALALAASASAIRIETSPSYAETYASTTPTGVVKFTFGEVDSVHGTRSTQAFLLTGFRFHDACTSSLTKIHKTLRARHLRFRYHAGDITIAAKMASDRRSPRITGTITVAGLVCAGDPGGQITFKATPGA